jgi:hypothetical protein
MPGLSDYSARRFLDYITGKTNVPALPTAYVALFTAVGADDGTGFTEVSGGSYARKQSAGSDWNAAAGSAPSTVSNAAALTYPIATADWGTAIAFGLFDAATVGNLMAWDFLGNFPWKPATISLASPGVFTCKAHGFANGDPIRFTTEFGGDAPSFSQSNLTGTLVVANATTDTFTVTNGGIAVNTSSTGSGMVRKILQQAIPNGVQASFAIGALNLSAA